MTARLTRSTSHLMFSRWQSPVLLSILALRLGIKVEKMQNTHTIPLLADLPVDTAESIEESVESFEASAALFALRNNYEQSKSFPPICQAGYAAAGD